MKNFIPKFFNREKYPFVVIVSGLPRSGTSMMMNMLEAGGLSLMVDQNRKPDRDNPKGYFEYQAVKRLPKEDTTWLKKCRGKAIKIVSPLLIYLPDDLPARIIFMRREMKEILLSQQKMLQRRNASENFVEEKKLSTSFSKHLREVEFWLAERKNLKTLNVDFASVIGDPLQQARKVNHFLGGNLFQEKMAGVVEKKLYRQRSLR